MSSSSPAAGPSPEGLGPVRVLLPSIAAVNAVMFAAFGALTAVILPARVETIDPTGKVDSLAMILAVSAGFTLLAQPLVGALSDQTRSRFGRRLPWVAGGSLVGGAFLIAFAGFDTVVWLAVGWTVIQFALNGVDVALTANVVDRFPAPRRGRAFGVIGAAAIGGGALGTLLAGFAPERHAILGLVLGLLVIAVAAVFAIVNREPSSIGRERRRLAFPAFLRGFWLNPRRSPAFAWMFASRFVFILGTQSIFSYLLYILIDHLRLDRGAAAGLVGVSVAVGAAAMFAAIALVGWLSDRVARRVPFLLAACGLNAVGAVLMLVAPSIAMVIAYAVLHGVGAGVYLVVGITLTSEVIPDPAGAAGKNLGVYNVATNAAQIVAPILAAVVIGSFGGYPLLFGVALVLVVVAALLVLPLRRTH